MQTIIAVHNFYDDRASVYVFKTLRTDVCYTSANVPGQCELADMLGILYFDEETECIEIYNVDTDFPDAKIFDEKWQEVKSDYNLSPDELKVKYVTKYPAFPKDKWIRSVKNNNTVFGYWEWASIKLNEQL